MAVLFTVHGVWYYGQYSFKRGIWTTIPGDEKSRSFPDLVVETWAYPPDSKKVFDEYAEAVALGNAPDSIFRTVDCHRWILHYDEPAKA